MALAGPAFIIMWHDVAAHAEADYDRWHTREHMPERLGIPGFLRGRRGVDWSLDRHRYLTIYEGESVEVFGSPAYLERLNNPTPWSGRITPTVSNFIRGACDVVAGVGAGLGGVTMTIRLRADRERMERFASDAAALVASMGNLDGVAAVHIGSARLAVSGAKTRETQLRGNRPEETFDAAIVVDGTSRRALAASQGAILSILEGSGLSPSPDSIAIYDLSFALSANEVARS